MHPLKIHDEMLILLMKGLMYHCLSCILLNLASQKTMLMNLKLLLLFVPLFLFAVLRVKCSRFFLFILFHAAICGAFLMVFPQLEERIAAGGCTVLLAAGSMYKRLFRDTEDACPPIASLALFLLAYLAAEQMQRPQVMQICYYEAFLFLILFAAYKNISETAYFLKMNEKMENLPTDQIKGMNQMMLVLFILSLTAGMLLMPYLPVGSLFDVAGCILRMILRGLILLIMWICSKDVSESGLSGGNVEQAIPPMETGEASMLAKVFEYVIMTAAYVALAVGVVYLAGRLFYELYRRFYEQHREAADESEFIWENPVLKERVVRQRKKKEHLAGRSINQKIRRLYKKSIRHQFGKTSIPTTLTPVELEELLLHVDGDSNIWKSEEVQQRVTLYEKARYSQHICEKEDIEKMKQHLKMDR